jgi:hypothetical protein
MDTLRYSFYYTIPLYHFIAIMAKMKIKYRVYEPASPALPDTAVTIGNTIGNSLDGNCGDKARFLSTLLRMRVCAYQRPGTGDDPPGRSHRSQGDDFLKHVTEAGYELNDHLGSEGVEQVVIASHSADGPFGITLATCEQLPVVAFASSDPVGVRRVSTIGGFVRWASYQRRQGKPGHPSPHTPPEWKAPPEISDDNVRKEMRLNHRIWRGPRIVAGLLHIARYMPGIAVNVVLPERSFNGNPAFMQQKAVELNAFGDMRPEGAQPFRVGYELGRAHRFYDDPRYFGGLVVDTLVSLGHQPEAFVHPMYQEPTFRHAGAVA